MHVDVYGFRFGIYIYIYNEKKIPKVGSDVYIYIYICVCVCVCVRAHARVCMFTMSNIFKNSRWFSDSDQYQE